MLRVSGLLIMNIFGDIGVSMGNSFYSYRRAGTTRSEFGGGSEHGCLQNCGMFWGSLSSVLNSPCFWKLPHRKLTVIAHAP